MSNPRMERYRKLEDLTARVLEPAAEALTELEDRYLEEQARVQELAAQLDTLRAQVAALESVRTAAKNYINAVITAPSSATTHETTAYHALIAAVVACEETS